MKVLLVLLVAAFGAQADNRIVGGDFANDGQYPYQISLHYGTKHNCGGSILAADIVLTAAHCVSGLWYSRMSILAGTNKLDDSVQRLKVKSYAAHENYDAATIVNDIGVIRLATPFTFSSKVATISLETAQIGAGVDAVLSGWGYLSFPNIVSVNELQHIGLQTISNEQCVNDMRPDSPPVKSTNLCTLSPEGQGACKGDSGGPLAANGKQIGVVSWGWPCAQGEPDVFTRVSAFLDWIEKTTETVI